MKMSEPVVSVIIPIYNREKYLRACLSSVLRQTHSALQIICVNDGSTDSSLPILEELAHADSRILVVNQANAGPPAARKAALAHATGEYVYCIDSDDWIEQDYIEKMAHVLQAKNLDVLFNKNIIKASGDSLLPFRDCKDIPHDGWYNFEYIPPSLWSRLYKINYILDCFKNIPKDIILEDVYIHYTSMRTMNTFYCIKGPAYYYRFHDESIMTNYIKSFDMITVVEMIYKFYKDNNILSQYHIPFELLYNKIESHVFKVEFQNKIRTLLHKIGDDFFANSTLYHGYILALTKAFLASSPDDDLAPRLRTFTMASLRDTIKRQPCAAQEIL